MPPVTQDHVSLNGTIAIAELTGVRYYNACSTSKVPQPVTVMFY
jgi:hypothetical protein